MISRWRFAWAWVVGAVLALVLPSCASLPIEQDRDGDGVPDFIDQCPDVPGPLENLGCPLPVAEPYDCANPPALTGLIPVKGAIQGRYIVMLKPRTASALSVSAVKSLASKYGAEDVQTFKLVSGFAAKIDVARINRLLAEPDVQYIQQEGTKRINALSWGLDRIDQREGKDGKYTPLLSGLNVHAFVPDTGVTKTADLGDRFGDGYSAFGGTPDDDHGHGTHVSGTIAGIVWGVCKECIIHPVKVLDKDGSGTDSQVINGLEWITAYPLPDGHQGVVNASWGGSPAPAVDAAVCKVIESGKVFVAAAGNESSDAYSSTPARVVQVLTIGAMDSSDAGASFTNYGPGVDLFAPGVDIESDTPSGGTAVYSGTSMATPHVVGAAALYFEAHRSATPAQVHDGIVAESTPDTLIGLPTEDTPNKLLYVQPAAAPPAPTPEPTPEPIPTPPPVPATACPKALAEGAQVYLNDKAYGQGWDSTVRVKGDAELCQIVHGVAIDDCHLEGWPKRVECEMELIGGCPVWQYTPDNGTNVYPCSDDQTALASCDHFGSVEYRDDPQTPLVFEGQPAECGLQRDAHGPIAGFFTVAHGKAQVRACKPDGQGCGPWREFDH